MGNRFLLLVLLFSLSRCLPHAEFVKTTDKVYPSLKDKSLVKVFLDKESVSKKHRVIGFIIVHDHYNDIKSIIESAKIEAGKVGGNAIIFARKDISDAFGWSNLGGQLTLNIMYDYYFKVLFIE